MIETTNFDDPNDINSLTMLKIQTVSGNISPRIYANGKNQLPIEILVKAANKHNKPLTFSKDTWLNMLSLRFAESDRNLNLNGNSNWCYTAEENEFSKEISGDMSISGRISSGNDNLAIIILYVYTDTIGTRRVAVSVDTDNGKHFTTADNASGAEKMSVRVNAISPIKYGIKTNVMIINGDFVELTNNLGWTSRLTTEGPYKEHYNGICQRRIVSILPNFSITGQRNFAKHEIAYEPIKDSDVNDGTIGWQYGVNRPQEDCFALLQIGAGYPCAVIGRGRSNFQLNLWYSRQNSINIDGQVFLRDDSYYYRFCPYVEETHYGDDEEGVATLLLYKFIMPDNNSGHYKWHNKVRPVTVKVTDFYGNEGIFGLTFDDDENFNTPGLV